jgi:biotin carboxylase
MRKRIVVVESNASLLHVIPYANQEGWEVVFVYSHQNAHWFNHDLEGHLKLAHQVIEVRSTEFLELKDVLAQLLPIEVVISSLETTLLTVSQACEAVGVPFTASESIQLAQDKHRARMILKDLDPTSCELVKRGQLAPEQRHYPVFLKPRQGTGSIGAKKILSKAQLVEELAKAEGDLIVEQFLEGRMLSVEVAKASNGIHFLMVGERRRSRTREQVELGTIMPAPLTLEELASVKSFVTQVILRLKLNLGIFHIEVMLCSDGPHLIEVNPRLMGGSLPILFNFSTGENIFKYLVEVYGGKDLVLPDRFVNRFAMSRIFGAAEDGRLIQGDFFSKLSDLEGPDFKIVFWKRPGDVVRRLETNMEYIGYFFIRESSVEEADARCESILKRIEAAIGVELLR